jgi:hypothetical protein
LPAAPVAATLSPADVEHARRWQRLEDLIAQRFGGRTVWFCTAAKKNEGQVCLYRNKSRPIGERFCRDVEAQLNRPGWFANGYSAEVANDAAAGCTCADNSDEELLLTLFRELDQKAQALHLVQLEAQAKTAIINRGGTPMRHGPPGRSGKKEQRSA